jgi:glycosyltransferase involved in cell wall biosynthesis
MTAPRLLLVGYEFYRTGASLCLYRLARHLSAQGYVLDLIAMTEQPGGLEADYAALGINRLARYEPIVSQRYAAAIVNSLSCGPALPKIGPGVPCLWWIHEAEMGLKMILSQPLLADGFRHVQTIVLQSEHQRAVLGSFLCELDAPVLVIPNAPAVTPLVPVARSERTRIVSIGTVEPRKRQEDLIRAVEAMPAEQRDRFEVVIVGRHEAPDAAALALAARHPARYRLLGELPHGEALGWLASADIYALPSGSESQAISVLEAMRAGAPVCVSDLSVYRSLGIRHGILALMHPPSDIELLGANLRTLRDSPALRARLTANGKAYAARFTETRFFGALEAAIRGIMR